MAAATKSKFSPIALLMVAAALYLLLGDSKGCTGPGPVDPPKTALFKTDKLAVLVLGETEAQGKYTADQLLVINGGPTSLVDKYIAAHNGTWLTLDVQNVDLSLLEPWVAEAVKVPHPTLPFVIASNAKAGFSGPLVSGPELIKSLDAIEGK